MGGKINKIRWLLLVPIYGGVIIMAYIFVSQAKRNSFSMKKFSACLFMIGLCFFVGFIVMTLFMRFINIFTDIREFAINYGFYVSFIFGGYFMNIPIMKYVKDNAL